MAHRHHSWVGILAGCPPSIPKACFMEVFICHDQGILTITSMLLKKKNHRDIRVVQAPKTRAHGTPFL